MIVFILGFPLVVITAFLIFERTEIVFLIYIITIPLFQHFNTISFNLGDFVITPSMIFHFFIIIFVFNKYLLTHEKNNYPKLNYLDTALILFLVFSLFSLIYAYDLPVNHTKRWLLFYTGQIEVLTLYFVVKYYVFNNNVMIKKIVFAIVLSSFSAFLIFLLETNNLQFNILKLFMERMRIGFGYHNTNLFGIHSAVLIPIVFTALYREDLMRYRLSLNISFYLLLTLSLLCFNRGTFLVLGLQLFLLYFNKDHRKLIHFVVVLLLIVGLIFNQLVVFYISRFMLGGSSDTVMLDPSTFFRLEAWRIGLNTLFIYPFGVGAGGFQFVWEQLSHYPNIYLGTPHHLFLSIGVDYGIIPLLTFFVFVGIAYYYSHILYKDKETSRDEKYLFFGIKVSIISYVAYGLITDGELSHLTGFTWPNNGYTLYFFTLLALISHYYNNFKLKDG